MFEIFGFHVQLKSSCTGKELLERHSRLQPCQWGPKAQMDAPTKSNVSARSFPLDVNHPCVFER